jgi:hypothetical protein
METSQQKAYNLCDEHGKAQKFIIIEDCCQHIMYMGRGDGCCSARENGSEQIMILFTPYWLHDSVP